MLEVTPVPAFRDNYIWLIRGLSGSAVAIVDPGDAAPVRRAVAELGLEPAAVLVTHHHWDHSGGVETLVREFDIPAWGPAGERVAGLSHPVAGGDRARLSALELEFDVLDIPGHTAGHIAFHGHGAVFCGDTLFSAGCGRLFEGTAEQMLESLDTLAALPDDTRVYCGHEYTVANLRFAAEVEPDNQAVAEYRRRADSLRRANQPTLPSTLGLEREVNPFLRCDEPAVADAAGRRSGERARSRTEVFAAVRRWKDEFA
jgi:hydroxyacylglutathione hydrolase